VTDNEDTKGVLAPYWYLAFDGGPDRTNSSVLIARERDDGYTGFWSYDPALAELFLNSFELFTDSANQAFGCSSP